MGMSGGDVVNRVDPSGMIGERPALPLNCSDSDSLNRFGSTHRLQPLWNCIGQGCQEYLQTIFELVLSNIQPVPTDPNAATSRLYSTHLANSMLEQLAATHGGNTYIHFTSQDQDIRNASFIPKRNLIELSALLLAWSNDIVKSNNGMIVGASRILNRAEPVLTTAYLDPLFSFAHELWHSGEHNQLISGTLLDEVMAYAYGAQLKREFSYPLDKWEIDLLSTRFEHPLRMNTVKVELCDICAVRKIMNESILSKHYQYMPLYCYGQLGPFQLCVGELHCGACE